MSEPLNGVIPKRERVFAVMSKVIALLGLAALAFLLTRPTTTLSAGWLLLVVAVIRLSLSYSPTSEPSANQAPVPIRSTECRGYYYRADGHITAKR